ncbi:ParB N-terminal domain-containing protein [Pseudooceanicola sp. CBS1P-1]|uniref:Replication protein n=1 Tax=Pseudooceanicola albus TaxID=2692189 RepID=A0A6L7G7S0_9RHOB|nr:MULTISPECIES: ParB N-terminal domain-containing protein [Pseudooceanicola]MBT9385991.1 ParB N-terminal domain-containing protein [Pseudooceanicola endophyticus]MXN19588.1 replication protein [Pseudooceanicola albus]
MARKRRMFDIEMPDEAPGAAPEPIVPAGKVAEDPPEAPVRRRGPMATAIGENAESSRARHEIEAQIRAENDALAHEHMRLKRLGLVMELLPLESIDTAKLVRDRAKGIDYELGELKASLAALGLSNPIRVEARADGRYELVQGFRRLAAYRALLEETGDTDRWGTIPAAVSQPGDELETLYRRMVDENLVRKDISFAEMAQLALDYAADPSTQEDDADKAVAELFQSAGYQKRSYIRSFIKLMARLGDTLRFAPDIPRALGLALVQKIEEVEGVVPAIKAELAPMDNRSVRDEIEVLRRHAGLSEAAPAPKTPAPKAKTPGTARTSFQFQRREGRARCTASNGRLELRLERDFSTIDRRKLEEAVKRMLDQLD